MTRTALITGAGKGIGEAISLALAGQGLRVALAARTAADLERVAGLVRAQGGQAFPVVCDVTDAASVAAAVAAVTEACGPINVLVNNAGAAASHKFLDHDDALWQRMLDVNLTSVYRVTKAVAPMMVAARWGSIINVASIASKVGGKYLAAYTAAKHGVLGLMKNVAAEYADQKIRCNSVLPGITDTAMMAASFANNPPEYRKRLEATVPGGELCQPEEIAETAVWLCSDRARRVNGQGIVVDGGGVLR